MILGENEAGDFIVSVQPDGPHFAVLVLERKNGVRVYVDLLTDSRFAWFEWVQKIGAFEVPLQMDQLVEYNDRVTTLFQRIQMPVQRLTAGSVERLLDLCSKASKAGRKR